LGAAAETFTTGRRHRDFFLGMAIEAGVRWFDVPGWSRRVDDDADNLRSALAWSLEEGDEEAALTIAATLAGYWLLTSKVDGIEWLERALAGPARLAVPARAGALTALGLVPGTA